MFPATFNQYCKLPGQLVSGIWLNAVYAFYDNNYSLWVRPGQSSSDTTEYYKVYWSSFFEEYNSSGERFILVEQQELQKFDNLSYSSSLPQGNISVDWSQAFSLNGWKDQITAGNTFWPYNSGLSSFDSSYNNYGIGYKAGGIWYKEADISGIQRYPKLIIFLDHRTVTPDPDPPDPVLIWGCTDPSATNYDPSATNDDGSCLFAPVLYKTYLMETDDNGIELDDIQQTAGANGLRFLNGKNYVI